VIPDERTRQTPPLSIQEAQELLRNTLILYGVRATDSDLTVAAGQLRAVLRRLAALDGDDAVVPIPGIPGRGPQS
jgi:hypothetical protein